MDDTVQSEGLSVFCVYVDQVWFPDGEDGVLYMVSSKGANKAWARRRGVEVWPGQFALVGEKSPGFFPNLPPKPHFFTVGTVILKGHI